MPAIVLDVLKYFFILLIFLFLARAVRAMFLEIAGPKATRSPGRSKQAQAARPRPGRPPERLAVTGPDGKTRSYDIGDELMIGRGERCQVILEDTYASQIHARIFAKDETVFIEDMGSTNGTYLNRKKVTSAIQVARGDKARIGKTEMEFKR